MAIAIAASSNYTAVGNQDATGNGITIPLPGGLSVGDYIIASVYFAQATGTANVVTPSGWTILTPTGSASNRLLVLYGYKITDPAALSAVGSSFQAKVGVASTRVVANVHRLTGVNLTATPAIGALEFSSSSSSTYTFGQPNNGDTRLYFLGTNYSSPSPNATYTSTGGSLVATNRSVNAATGNTADSQLSTFIEGSGAVSSAASANHVSFGIGFASQANNATPVASYTYEVNNLAITTQSTSFDSDGSIVSYDWNWGDSTTHATTTNASHTYAAPGTYTVVLTVTDNGGATAATSKTFTIVSTKRRPAIVGTPTTAIVTDVTQKKVTLAKPVGLANGEWLIAALRAQESNSTGDFTSSGWTRLGPAFVAGSSNARVAGFYGKYIANAANETATAYDFTWTGDGGRAVGMLFRVKNADATNLVDASSPDYASSRPTNGVSIPTFHSPNANGLQLVLAANEQTSPHATATTSHSSGYTFMQMVASSTSTSISRTSMELFTRNQEAGATPVFEAYWEMTAGATAQSIVLRGSSIASASPVAQFTLTKVGLTVTVTDASTAGDEAIASVSYSWGDSTSTTAANTSHTYASAGTYTITQTITDAVGATSTASQTVTVSVSKAPLPLFGTGNATTTTTVASLMAVGIKPTNLQNGDLLVAYVYLQQSEPVVAVPDGWLLLRAFSTRGSGIYVKPVPVASVETASSYTWTAKYSLRNIVTVFRVTGANLDSPLDVAGTQSTEPTNISSFANTSITTTESESLLLGFNYWNNSSSTVTTITPPSALTIGVQASTPTTANTSGTLISYQQLPGLGSTGSLVFSYAPNATNGSGLLLALRKVAAMPSVAFTIAMSNATIYVDATPSFGTYGATITSYDIDWGDGSTHGTAATASHTYNNRGTYTVTVTLTDSNGLTSSKNKQAMVLDNGYAGIWRDANGNNYPGIFYYWDGTSKHGLAPNIVRKHTPVTVSEFLSPARAPWFSAHRGFSYSYPEETLYGYQGATDAGIKAIEISVHYSADGTPWCFHDSTTTRTTGYTGSIASLSDAVIAGLSNMGATATANPGQPSRPTAKLVDVLNIYASTHVIIIEDKTYTHTTSMLNLMDSYGTPNRPASEIFIWKASWNAGASFYSAAAARGYHRWAYIFDSDMGSIATLAASGKADLIGMDFNSSDATLTNGINVCNANGVMPTGHIVNSAAQRDRLLGLGMKGIMISNKDIVPAWYIKWQN